MGFLCFHGNFRRKRENPSGEDEAVAPRKVRRSRVKPRQTEPDPRISKLHTYIEPQNIIAPRTNAGNPSTVRRAEPGARQALDLEPEPWTVAAVERRISQLEMENRVRLSYEAESERRRRQTYDKIRTEEMMTGRLNRFEGSRPRCAHRERKAEDAREMEEENGTQV
ncbi:hypothetical protein B0O99DRAFT_638670 [Bisporella sp. PMI_857]|nr:hypothetical protein B0O99DRAFT_638670 [Bisporella sp. PMI_857]